MSEYEKLAEQLGDIAVEMTGDDYRAMFDAKHALLSQQAEIARLNARVAELEKPKTPLKRSAEFCGQPIMYIADVVAETGKPQASIYRESREGTFPNALKIGKRRQAWLKSDIDKWIQQILQQRKGGQS
ncbi:MAG: AlpA family phage regulatory protein [Moraxellaceae bacterium]